MTPEERAREIVDALINTLERLDGTTEEWPSIIATALREARVEALEEAHQAVWDAGGDNTEWHCNAIRALKDKT